MSFKEQEHSSIDAIKACTTELAIANKGLLAQDELVEPDEVAKTDYIAVKEGEVAEVDLPNFYDSSVIVNGAIQQEK